MAIWGTKFTLEEINAMASDTIIRTLGIEFTEIGEDFLVGRMPVDERTVQPAGLLHGGASVVLAETLGSLASTLIVDRKTHFCVGLEVNANHIRPMKSGFVYGKTKPIHIGRTTHLWQIQITNEEEKLVCISRLTIAVREIN